MSNIVNLFRGGAPDVKCLFCGGQFAEFHPPFSTPAYDATPPYNSHADAAQGQGYLNLTFPLVPRLGQTMAHLWQVKALHNVKAEGDVILTNWIPMRSFVTDIHWEVTKMDESMEGVYLKPVAYRAVFDYDSEEFVYKANDDYASQLSSASVPNLPIGKAEEGDVPYGVCHLSDPKCTFGHNIPKYDDDGKPTGGLDDWFGAVILGYEIVGGTEDQMKLLPNAHFAVYSCAKCLSFECPSQL